MTRFMFSLKEKLKMHDRSKEKWKMVNSECNGSIHCSETINKLGCMYDTALIYRIEEATTEHRRDAAATSKTAAVASDAAVVTSKDEGRPRGL
ncbi:hypothetical protein VNO78_34192 [Psophocarpus tetragonolobus]|uniref:Uncharacterized protein n=1 Tax=Psophocarpus tetragonolobus TaxID=3891 RepID=A0AAN9NVK3_PSOTE